MSAMLSYFEHELDRVDDALDSTCRETTEEAIKGTLSTAHATGSDTVCVQIEIDIR